MAPLTLEEALPATFTALVVARFSATMRSRAFCLLRARDGEDRTDIHPARARLHRCDERLAERDSRNLHGEVGYRIECHSSRRSD